MWAVSADIAPLRCEKNTPQNEIWQLDEFTLRLLGTSE